MDIYIEAGAHDGEFQSNTLHFDEDVNSKCILIEPCIKNFTQCKKNRSEKNYFFNCALVGFDFKDSQTELFEKNHAEKSIHQNGYMENSEFKPTYNPNGQIVKCRTLQSILDELKIYNIEKFFLDVEGYELEVLKGIDYEKTIFNEIISETHSNALFKTEEEEEKAVTAFLNSKNYYKIDETKTKGHIIYKLK